MYIYTSYSQPSNETSFLNGLKGYQVCDATSHAFEINGQRFVEIRKYQSMWISALFISFEFADELRNTLDKMSLRFMRMKSSDLENSTSMCNRKILRIDIRK